MTVTVDTILTWKMRERAHYNGGKEWFGYGHQCVEEPRLYRIDRYQRATRSVESEWQVDGQPVPSLEAAAEMLNIEPTLAGEEGPLLLLVTPEYQRRSEIKAHDAYASLEEPFTAFHYLDRKGMVEWEDGRVRLTRRGHLAKLGIEESNASGTPSWEAVSRRVNAERAALATPDQPMTITPPRYRARNGGQ